MGAAIFGILLALTGISYGIGNLHLPIYAGIAGVVLLILGAVAVPELGLLLTLIALFTNVLTYLGGRAFRVLAIITLVAWLIRNFQQGEISLSRAKFDRAILGLFGVALFSTIFAPDYHLAFVGWNEFAKALLLYFLLINVVRTQRLFQVVLWTVLLSAMSAGVVGIYQFFFQRNLWNVMLQHNILVRREAATMGDPNYWAMTLVGILPLTIALFKSSRSLIGKMTALCAAGLFVINVLSTFSRSGLVALVIVVLLLTFKESRPKWIAPLIFLGIILAVVLVFPQVLWIRIQSLLSGAGPLDPSIRFRLTLASAAMHTFLEHPLFGVGFWNFAAFATRYTAYPMVCHNMYLEIASGLGIFGLLFFVLILGKTFTELRRQRRVLQARGVQTMADFTGYLFIGLVGLCVAGSFLSVPFKPELWLIIGLTAVLERLSDYELEAVPDRA